MSWVYFLKDKSETYDHFKKFKVLVEKQSGKHIKKSALTVVENFLPNELLPSVKKMAFSGNSQLHMSRNKMVLQNGKIERWLK